MMMCGPSALLISFHVCQPSMPLSVEPTSLKPSPAASLFVLKPFTKNSPTSSTFLSCYQYWSSKCLYCLTGPPAHSLYLWNLENEQKESIIGCYIAAYNIRQPSLSSTKKQVQSRNAPVVSGSSTCLHCQSLGPSETLPYLQLKRKRTSALACCYANSDELGCVFHPRLCHLFPTLH
jgi:hypothetical protein